MQASTRLLDGRTAVVTGGGSGIGEAVALSFANAGAKVVITGRRDAALQAVADQAPADRPIAWKASDVGDRDSVNAFFQWAESELGHIDILVHSAGLNIPKRSMADMVPEDWDMVQRVNSTGAYNCLYAVLPGMRKRRDGVIINISSVAGLRTDPVGGVAYNASKFALSALTRSVGMEERENGIRLTAIYPGEVATPILDRRPVPVTAEHRARILQAEDIAAAALMVAALPPRARVPELVMIPTTQAFI